MGIYFDFPLGWWLVLGLLYGSYLLIYFLRRKRGKDEARKQLIAGFASLFIGFIIEFVGVSLKLWTLLPANWPITVWIAYFGVGILGYQIVKRAAEIKGK